MSIIHDDVNHIMMMSKSFCMYRIVYYISKYVKVLFKSSLVVSVRVVVFTSVLNSGVLYILTICNYFRYYNIENRSFAAVQFVKNC